MDYQEILSFWFEEIDSSLWWKKDDDFDGLIRHRFLSVHQQATQCELFEWRTSSLGRLAEVIVLDQFSRNLFRDLPQAFTSDALALALAQEAISLGQDADLSPVERSFLYMPFMHSESLAIHDVAVSLFEKNGIQSTLEFEHKHRDIIVRFGRYPHRNAILNRESSTEELEFLAQPGSSF
ncbi:MAG: DUF924 family protein [Cellvibrionaceae bacterium]